MGDRPRQENRPPENVVTDRTHSFAGNGAASDIDALETGEWLEALDAVLAHDGPVRARQLLSRVVERAHGAGAGPTADLNTPYVNTIPAEREPPLPGDPAVERRLRSLVRWNAIAMVVVHTIRPRLRQDSQRPGARQSGEKGNPARSGT